MPGRLCASLKPPGDEMSVLGCSTRAGPGSGAAGGGSCVGCGGSGLGEWAGASQGKVNGLEGCCHTARGCMPAHPARRPTQTKATQPAGPHRRSHRPPTHLQARHALHLADAPAALAARLYVLPRADSADNCPVQRAAADGGQQVAHCGGRQVAVQAWRAVWRGRGRRRACEGWLGTSRASELQRGGGHRMA